MDAVVVLVVVVVAADEVGVDAVVVLVVVVVAADEMRWGPEEILYSAPQNCSNIVAPHCPTLPTAPTKAFPQILDLNAVLVVWNRFRRPQVPTQRRSS